LTLLILLLYNLRIRTAESSGWSWVELRVGSSPLPAAKKRESRLLPAAGTSEEFPEQFKESQQKQ